MSGQSPQSPSVIERRPLLRYAFVLLFVVIGTFMVWTTWDASASTLVNARDVRFGRV